MSGHINWLASGSVPQTTSTRRILWAKKCAVIQQNSTSPDAANDPKPKDTIWTLRTKCVRGAKT